MSELNELKPVVRRWWRSLQGKNEDKGVNRRGQRASLKRCRTPLDAAFQDGFHELRQSLIQNTPSGWVSAHGVELQTLAVLLAHVRENAEPKLTGNRAGVNDCEKLAVTFAGGSDGKGGLSKLRFRRLLSHHHVDQGFFDSMLRSLKLVKGCVNVDGLTEVVCFWNEKKRRDLAYSFYARKMEIE